MGGGVGGGGRCCWGLRVCLTDQSVTLLGLPAGDRAGIPVERARCRLMSLSDITVPRRRSRRRREDSKLADHVERLGEEHPPIPLESVDYTIKRPRLLAERFGSVLAYMTRVELEVERNVLELNILLPDPPEVDRRFYADVWMPQETRHGLILDQMQELAGIEAHEPNLTDVDFKLKLL